MKTRGAVTSSLFQLPQMFPAMDSAMRCFGRVRWNGNPVCTKCGYAEKVTPQKKVGTYWCGTCRAYFTVLVMASVLLEMSPPSVWSQVDDSTHESDHLADEGVEVLETVHVHGLRLNKDQQRGPVPRYTPWPTMPLALQGREVDDWMKVRILVSKTADTRLVVLVPAKNRRLNLAGVESLKQWTFDPQMDGDDPVDGELTVRIHFRTQEKDLQTP